MVSCEFVMETVKGWLQHHPQQLCRSATVSSQGDRPTDRQPGGRAVRSFFSLFSDDRTTDVTGTELHGSGRLSLNRQEPAAVSAYKGESPTGVSTLKVDGCFGGWIMVGWLCCQAASKATWPVCLHLTAVGYMPAK